jgi:hypothetical protein
MGLDPIPSESDSRDIDEDGIDDFKPPRDEQQRECLHGRALLLAFFAWLMAEFMGGLGGNMLSPALPIVVSQFNGLNQLGWVSGAYYMTQCGCMLLFGQCLAIFNAKHVLMSATAFFMLGSCISGAAMNIETLTIGRALLVSVLRAAGCRCKPSLPCWSNYRIGPSCSGCSVFRTQFLEPLALSSPVPSHQGGSGDGVSSSFYHSGLLQYC